MGIILNPRGTAGAGKTELARRIVAEYGGAAAGQPLGAGAIGVRLRHPRGGRGLAVIGDYAATSGGCDRIRASEGGLEAAIGWAADCAASGDDVLLEGLRLSYEASRTRRLARGGRVHVLRLGTPPETCARHLVARRRMRRSSWPALVPALAADAARLDAACAQLRPDAVVETLPFDAALARARCLLGL